MTKNKFTFQSEDKKQIRHNLEPDLLIQIIQNDEDEYSVWNDCFELFEFKGNKFVILWLADEDELGAIDDYSHIRSILRRAWKFYKSQVFIEAKEFEAGEFETDRYKLDQNEDETGWVATDKLYLIVVLWKHKQFNDTQELVPLEDFDPDNFQLIAKILREIGEWLTVNHKDKL